MNVQSRHGPVWDWLDQVEGLLIRAISGILRFAIIKLPRLIADFVVQTFAPTVIKLVRVSMIAITAIGIVFGPFYLGRTSLFSKITPGWIPWTWLFVALAGATWGILQLRRCHSLRAAIRMGLGADDSDVVEDSVANGFNSTARTAA